MSTKARARFLCTGNSCRSHLAEAIVDDRRGDTWEAVPAGTQPVGYVYPKALQALAATGIEHDGRSKLAARFRNMPLDLLVTVCDSAAEQCPRWLGPDRRVHLGFPDPAKAAGTDEEIIAVFRAVRDDIAQKIPALLMQYSGDN